MAVESPTKDFDIAVSRKDAPTDEAASQDSHIQTKADFLASFTHEESKAIIRKVDRRFLLIIGLMYVIKNVSAF